MTEREIGEMLSMVPVFAIADVEGRPVLMKKNESSALPQQLLFTDVDVAKAHTVGVKKATNDPALELRLATLSAAHAFVAPRENATHDVVLVGDPRELHVARQLLLRAAGVETNYTNEVEVEAAAAKLETGLDLATGVALFTLDELRAPVAAEPAEASAEHREVQPWFMSFTDLAHAYVSKHANTSDPAASNLALAKMLSSGALTVTTLDRVLETMRAPGGAAKVEDAKGPRGAIIVPPASSVEILKQQLKQQQSGGAQPGVDESIAAAAKRINAEAGASGLFDEAGDDGEASLFD